MNCTRCRGLMIVDHFLDFDGSIRERWATSWRCVNCGQVYDPVIEQNRATRQDKVVRLPSGEPDYHDDNVHLGAESFIRSAA